MREASVPTPRALMVLSPPQWGKFQGSHCHTLHPRSMWKHQKDLQYIWHLKGNITIKNLLVSPKDKDPMANKSGAIYWVQVGDLACDDIYQGETSKAFGERFKEHLKDPSPIHDHSCTTGHTITQDNFQIIEREDHCTARLLRKLYTLEWTTPLLIEI